MHRLQQASHFFFADVACGVADHGSAVVCPAEAPSAAECDTNKDAAKEAAPATKDGAAKGSKSGKTLAAAPPKRSKKAKTPKGGHAGEHLFFNVL